MTEKIFILLCSVALDYQNYAMTFHENPIQRHLVRITEVS